MDEDAIIAIVQKVFPDQSMEKIRQFIKTEQFRSIFPDLSKALKAGSGGEESKAGTSKSDKKLTETKSVTNAKPKLPESESETDSNNSNCTAKVERKKKGKRPLESSGGDSSNCDDKPTQSKDVVKKKKLAVRSSSGNESDSESDSKEATTSKKKELSKKLKKVKLSRDPSDTDSDDNLFTPAPKVTKAMDLEIKPPKKDEMLKPKVHPFYMSPGFHARGKLFGNTSDKSQEKSEDKKKFNYSDHSKKRAQPTSTQRELKPVSHYQLSRARVGSGKHWKLYEDADFSKYKRRHGLKSLSVLCMDLGKMHSLFYLSSKGPKSNCSSSVPLRRHMKISADMESKILQYEQDKVHEFKPILNRIFQKAYQKRKGDKNEYRRRYSREKDRHSDISSKSKDRSKSNNPSVSNTASKSTKTQESRKEQRKRGLEELRQHKQEQSRNTRKLPWESEDYFEKKTVNKPPVPEKKEEKPKPVFSLGKIPKIPKKNVPGKSMQDILQEIEEANKQASKKTPVELKIPKISERPYEFKKTEKAFPANQLYEEVEKLLKSNTAVEAPQMPQNGDYAEYTIRKIGWWFLKQEKDPPPSELYHPELQDEKIYEDWFDPKSHHITEEEENLGCVSDPEGDADIEVLELDKNGKPKPPDEDRIDEYCGRTTLEAKIRRAEVPQEIIQDGHEGNKKDNPTLRRVMRVKPGCNYEKKHLEVFCTICDEKIFGQRGLGAHIRSFSHQQKFRNKSLELATYEAFSIPVAPKKQYNAKLVEYGHGSTPASTQSTSMTSPTVFEPTQLTSKAEIVRPDSPMAVVDDNDELPDVIILDNVDTDNLNLPTIENYDLEPDEDQIQAKVALRTANLWTPDMQSRWEKMNELINRITEDYNNEREKHLNDPENHPRKDSEWTIFWERRSMEVEAEGKDPDRYDYTTEWTSYWLTRMQELMKMEVEAKILQVKKSLALDVESLNIIMAQNNIKPQKLPKAQSKSSRQSSLSKNISACSPNTDKIPQIKPNIAFQNDTSLKPTEPKKAPTCDNNRTVPNVKAVNGLQSSMYHASPLLNTPKGNKYSPKERRHRHDKPVFKKFHENNSSQMIVLDEDWETSSTNEDTSNNALHQENSKSNHNNDESKTSLGSDFHVSNQNNSKNNQPSNHDRDSFRNTGKFTRVNDSLHENNKPCHPHKPNSWEEETPYPANNHHRIWNNSSDVHLDRVNHADCVKDQHLSSATERKPDRNDFRTVDMPDATAKHEFLAPVAAPIPMPIGLNSADVQEKMVSMSPPELGEVSPLSDNPLEFNETDSTKPVEHHVPKNKEPRNDIGGASPISDNLSVEMDDAVNCQKSGLSADLEDIKSSPEEGECDSDDSCTEKPSGHSNEVPTAVSSFMPMFNDSTKTKRPENIRPRNTEDDESSRPKLPDISNLGKNSFGYELLSRHKKSKKKDKRHRRRSRSRVECHAVREFTR